MVRAYIAIDPCELAPCVHSLRSVCTRACEHGLRVMWTWSEGYGSMTPKSRYGARSLNECRVDSKQGQLLSGSQVLGIYNACVTYNQARLWCDLLLTWSALSQECLFDCRGRWRVRHRYARRACFSLGLLLVKVDHMHGRLQPMGTPPACHMYRDAYNQGQL